ncbi:MAG: hypothetical protein J6N45_00115, partial [Alphaproteobacteria bacterium]|nr:hypothetical protein [Alphaproteobacteria bacterium]
MLKLTKTGIGLLTRQYRSVLKKCWAINVGVFALGAMAATSVPTTAEAESLQEFLIGSGTEYTLSADVQMPSETNINANYSKTINAGNYTIDGNGHSGFNRSSNSSTTLDINGGVWDGFYRNNWGGVFMLDHVGNIVSINSSVFSNNSARNSGGAVLIGGHNDDTLKASILNVTNSEFISNRSTGSGAGAISNEQSTMNVTGSLFQSNSAYTDGGAIGSGGNDVITDSNFISNSAGSDGGAISFFRRYLGATNSISGSTFTGNTAARYGGAIKNSSYLTISDSNFTGNTAGTYGGAIYNNATVYTLNFSGTNTFSNNKVNGSLNDIYNVGIINITGGTTTLNSGYIGESSSSFNINNGGTLEMGSSAAFSGGALNINYGGTAEMIDSKLQASTINNAGTLNLTMDGTSYTAKTIVNTGTLNVIHPNTQKDWDFRHNIDNSGGGTVVFDNQYTYNYWLQLEDKSITGGTVKINPTRGSGYSSNYVYLRGSNTWDISNLIAYGALYLSSSDKITTDALTNTSSGINNDGTFTLEGSGNNSLGRFSGSGTLNITNTGTTTANSTISNKINVGGSSTLNIASGSINNTISGSGIVKLSADTSMSSSYLSGPVLNMNGKTLTMGSTGQNTVAQLIGGGNLGVYLDPAYSSASSIYSSSSSNSGTYTITSIGGDIPTTNQSYTILSARGTTLDLSTAIKNATYSATQTSTGSDSIASTTPWTQDYYQNWSKTDTVYGKYSVSNGTTDKYLNYTVTSTSTGTKTNTGSMGDTLMLVNTASGTRNFNASSATSTYASKSSPGATNGTTNINGVVNGSNRSALNLSNNAGFSLDGSDIVNLSNMRLYGANSYTANLASANSKLTLNNTVLDGAQVYGSGMVELMGTNTVNAPLNNTGSTTVVSGTTTFNDAVNGFTNNGTVNVDASNITDEVTNNGTLNLSSGTLNYALTNTDTVNNSATINATITNSETGTFDNDGILAGNVDNSGTLMTKADALTGSSVTNNGTLELEGGTLTTSLLGTGRMKLMSGGVRLLATTPPTTTGSLSFGDSDDYVDSIATTIGDISSASEHAIATEAAVAAALATAGGGGTWGSITGTITDQTDLMKHLNNNYYTKGDVDSGLTEAVSATPTTSTSGATAINIIQYNSTGAQVSVGSNLTSMANVVKRIIENGDNHIAVARAVRDQNGDVIDTTYQKQLTGGTNITISDGTISAIDTTYSAAEDGGLELVSGTTNFKIKDGGVTNAMLAGGISTNKIETTNDAQFVSATDKSTWNSKQNALTIRDAIAVDDADSDMYNAKAIKAGLSTANTYAANQANTVKNNIETKLTNGATDGYEINAKSLKVADKDVLTVDSVIAADKLANAKNAIFSGTGDAPVTIEGAINSKLDTATFNTYLGTGADATKIARTSLDSSTTASLGKADSSIQSVALAGGTNNGTLKLTVNGVAADNIAVTGLGSAAYTDTDAYATAAQGTKAESAIQSVKVNNVALDPDSNKAVNITVAEGSTNGAIAVNGADVSVHGLGSAAYTDSAAYDAAGTAADAAAAAQAAAIAAAATDATTKADTAESNAKDYTQRFLERDGDNYKTVAQSVDAHIADLDANVSQTATVDNGKLALSITEVDGKLTGISGSITTTDAVTSGNKTLITSDGVYSNAKDGTYTFNTADNQYINSNTATTIGGALTSLNQGLKTLSNSVDGKLGTVTAGAPYIAGDFGTTAGANGNTVGAKMAILANKIGTLTLTDTHRGNAETVEGQLNNLDTAITNILAGNTKFTGFKMNSNAETPTEVTVNKIDNGTSKYLATDVDNTTLATTKTVQETSKAMFAGTNTWTGASNTFENIVNANGGIAVNTNKFKVTAGTGNTEVGGTLKVGEANAISGTDGSLAFGGNNLTGVGTISSGAITSTGAISGTSLSAGSGTISTTGAISGGTVTATTSVTTPKLMLGASGSENELTSVDVVSSADTTVQDNNKIVATKASVDRDVKANAKDADATAGAEGTTTEGVETIQGQLTALNNKIGTAGTITNASYISGDNTVTTNLNNLAGKLGTLSTSGNYISGSSVAGDLNALDSAIGTWTEGSNIRATSKTTGSVYNVASALTSLDSTLGAMGSLNGTYLTAHSGTAGTVASNLQSLNDRIGTITTTPYLTASAFSTGGHTIASDLTHLSDIIGSTTKGTGDSAEVTKFDAINNIAATMGLDYLAGKTVFNLRKDNGTGTTLNAANSIAHNLLAIDENIGDLSSTGIDVGKDGDKDKKASVANQLAALQVLIGSDGQTSGISYDLAQEKAARIASDNVIIDTVIGADREKVKDNEANAGYDGIYVSSYRDDLGQEGSGVETLKANTSVGRQLKNLDTVIGQITGSDITSSHGNIAQMTATKSADGLYAITITGSIADNLKSLDNAIGDRTYTSHNIVTQENDVATSISDIDAAVGAMNWNSNNGNIAEYVAAHTEGGQPVAATGTVAQNLKKIDTNIGKLSELKTGDSNKSDLVTAINSILSGSAEFTGFKMKNNASTSADVVINKVDAGNSQYLAAGGTVAQGSEKVMATNATVQATVKDLLGYANEWTNTNTFNKTTTGENPVTYTTVVDGQEIAMYNGAIDADNQAKNRKIYLNGSDGSAQFAGDLSIGDENVATSPKFKVTAENGNITTTGTITAAGKITGNNGIEVTADGSNLIKAEAGSSEAANNSVVLGDAGEGKKKVDLTVNGNEDVTGTLNVKGAVDLDSTLNVKGNTDLDGTLHAKGATTLDSTLTADGESKFAKGANDVYSLDVTTDGVTANQKITANAGIDVANGQTLNVGTSTGGATFKINNTQAVNAIDSGNAIDLGNSGNGGVATTLATTRTLAATVYNNARGAAITPTTTNSVLTSSDNTIETAINTLGTKLYSANSNVGNLDAKTEYLNETNSNVAFTDSNTVGHNISTLANYLGKADADTIAGKVAVVFDSTNTVAKAVQDLLLKDKMMLDGKQNFTQLTLNSGDTTNYVTDIDTGNAIAAKDGSEHTMATTKTIAATRGAINTEVFGVLGGIYAINGSTGDVTYGTAALNSGNLFKAKANESATTVSAASNLTDSLNNLANNLAKVTGSAINNDGTINNAYAPATAYTAYQTVANTDSLSTAIGKLDYNLDNILFTGNTQTGMVNDEKVGVNWGGSDKTLSAVLGDGKYADAAPSATSYGNVISGMNLTSAVEQIAYNIGSAVSPVARTKGKLGADATVNANISALDVAIGSDADLGALTTATTIATTQTVNQNIKALSNAINTAGGGNIVHRTDNEEITGTKTFKSAKDETTDYYQTAVNGQSITLSNKSGAEGALVQKIKLDGSDGSAQFAGGKLQISSAGDLSIGGANVADNPNFKVTAENGNVTTAGTITAAGKITGNNGIEVTAGGSNLIKAEAVSDATANSVVLGDAGDNKKKVDLTVNGNEAVTGTLNVNGTSSFHDNMVLDGDKTLTFKNASNAETAHISAADGSASLAGGKFTVGSDGNLNINSGKFTVGADGAVYADGTLGVKGVTTLTDALNANGGINADNGKFTVADDTGDVHTSGTLDVDSTSNFDGLATFNAGAKIVNGQALNVGDNTANSAAATFDINGTNSVNAIDTGTNVYTADASGTTLATNKTVGTSIANVLNGINNFSDIQIDNVKYTDVSNAEVAAKAGSTTTLATTQAISATRAAMDTTNSNVLGGIYKIKDDMTVEYDNSALLNNTTPNGFSNAGAIDNLSEALSTYAGNIHTALGGTFTDAGAWSSKIGVARNEGENVHYGDIDATSVSGALHTIHSNIGAAMTGTDRSNDAFATNASKTVNENLTALNAMLGADMADTLNYVSNTNTVNENIKTLDNKLGVWDNTYGNSEASAAASTTTVGSALNALDLAIGKRSDVSNQSFGTAYYNTALTGSVASSLTQLASSIGTNEQLSNTTLREISDTQTVNQNLKALANKISDNQGNINDTLGSIQSNNVVKFKNFGTNNDANTVGQAITQIDEKIGAFEVYSDEQMADFAAAEAYRNTRADKVAQKEALEAEKAQYAEDNADSLLTTWDNVKTSIEAISEAERTEAQVAMLAKINKLAELTAELTTGEYASADYKNANGDTIGEPQKLYNLDKNDTVTNNMIKLDHVLGNYDAALDSKKAKEYKNAKNDLLGTDAEETVNDAGTNAAKVKADAEAYAKLDENAKDAAKAEGGENHDLYVASTEYQEHQSEIEAAITRKAQLAELNDKLSGTEVYTISTSNTVADNLMAIDAVIGNPELIKSNSYINSENSIMKNFESLGAALGTLEDGNYIRSYTHETEPMTFAQNIKTLDTVIGKLQTGHEVRGESVSSDLKALDEAIGDRSVLTGSGMSPDASLSTNLKTLQTAISSISDTSGQVSNLQAQVTGLQTSVGMLTSTVGNKADKETTYTKTETDDKIKDIVDNKIGLASSDDVLDAEKTIWGNLRNLSGAVDTKANAADVKKALGEIDNGKYLKATGQIGEGNNTVAANLQSLAAAIDSENETQTATLTAAYKKAIYQAGKTGSSKTTTTADITGGTHYVYDYTGVDEENGTVNTIGQNLLILDDQVYKNTQAIANNKTALEKLVSESIGDIGTGATVKALLDQKADKTSVYTISDIDGKLGSIQGLKKANGVIDSDYETHYIYGTIKSSTGGESKATIAENLKALDDAVYGKVDINQTTENANKAMIVGADGKVTTGQIATGMIADEAVNTDKLAADAVTNAKLADNAVQSENIKDEAVTLSKLAKQSADDANKVLSVGADGVIGKSLIANANVAEDAAIASSKIAFTTEQKAAFNSGVTADKLSGYDTSIAALEETVGKEATGSTGATGLVKDVADLQEAVGDSNSGLIKDVADLKGTGSGSIEARIDSKVGTLENGHDNIDVNATIAANLQSIGDTIGSFTADAPNVINKSGSVRSNLEQLDTAVGKVSELKDYTEAKGNLTNGGAKSPSDIVTALENIDLSMGRIHHLVQTVDGVKGVYSTTVRSTTGSGTNLWEGTTVEDHLVSLDNAIGNLKLTGITVNNVVGAAVSEQLRYLNSETQFTSTEVASGANYSAGSVKAAIQSLNTEINTLKTSTAHATTADSAEQATKDAAGNVIVDTYATKTELGNVVSGTTDIKFTASHANSGDGTLGVIGNASETTVANALNILDVQARANKDAIAGLQTSTENIIDNKIGSIPYYERGTSTPVAYNNITAKKEINVNDTPTWVVTPVSDNLVALDTALGKVADVKAADAPSYVKGKDADGNYTVVAEDLTDAVKNLAENAKAADDDLADKKYDKTGGAISGDVTIGGTLGVTGATTLGSLNADATTLSSLSIGSGTNLPVVTSIDNATVANDSDELHKVLATKATVANAQAELQSAIDDITKAGGDIDSKVAALEEKVGLETYYDNNVLKTRTVAQSITNTKAYADEKATAAQNEAIAHTNSFTTLVGENRYIDSAKTAYSNATYNHENEIYENVSTVKGALDKLGTQITADGRAIATLTSGKQDKLTAGANITIDGDNK